MVELKRRAHRLVCEVMFWSLPNKIPKGSWTTRGLLGLVARVPHDENDLHNLASCLSEACCTAPTEAGARGPACHRTRHRAR